jgi:hypothetical protein
MLLPVALIFLSGKNSSPIWYCFLTKKETTTFCSLLRKERHYDFSLFKKINPTVVLFATISFTKK